jgi:hypothetical protein
MAGRWLSADKHVTWLFSASPVDGSPRISGGSASTACRAPTVPLSACGLFIASVVNALATMLLIVRVGGLRSRRRVLPQCGDEFLRCQLQMSYPSLRW